MLAAVSVCIFTGLFGGLLVYLAQLVWPNYSSYPNIETAFIDVTQRVGGVALFRAMAILLVLANIGAGMTTQVGAARLLFGMGRDAVLPKRIFGYLDAKTRTPVWNIWLIGLLAYLGSLLLSYELTAEILNFGAFLGFMGVNFAVFWQFSIKCGNRRANVFTDAVLPLLGFAFCTLIWIDLGSPAKFAGGVWFVLGVIALAVHTRLFRLPVTVHDPSQYE